MEFQARMEKLLKASPEALEKIDAILDGRNIPQAREHTRLVTIAEARAFLGWSYPRMRRAMADGLVACHLLAGLGGDQLLHQPFGSAFPLPFVLKSLKLGLGSCLALLVQDAPLVFYGEAFGRHSLYFHRETDLTGLPVLLVLGIPVWTVAATIWYNSN